MWKCLKFQRFGKQERFDTESMRITGFGKKEKKTEKLDFVLEVEG